MSEKHRVAVICRYCFVDTVGGIENHIRFVAREFVNQGVDVLMLYPKRGAGADRTYIAEQLSIREVYFSPPKWFQALEATINLLRSNYLSGFIEKLSSNFAAQSLERAIVEFAPDVVHQHDFISSISLGRRIAKNYVMVLTNHSGEYLLLKRSWLGRKFLKWYVGKFSAVIGPSDELCPHEFNKRTFFIPNGADLQVFFPRPVDVRISLKRSYGFKDDDFVVTCPRRWAPTKGIAYLAEAIRLFNFPQNVKFAFVGSDYAEYPAYVQQIHKTLAEVKQPGSFKLLGNLQPAEVSEVLSFSDVVVVPSLLEATSLVAIEAMASGSVVVASSVGGMPQLIINEQNGLLVPPRSPEHLFRAIMKLHDDQVLHRRLAGRALLDASKYDWSFIGAKTLQVLFGEISLKGPMGSLSPVQQPTQKAPAVGI